MAALENPFLVGSLEIVQKVLLVNAFDGIVSKVLDMFSDLERVRVLLKVAENRFATVGTFCLTGIFKKNMLEES